MKNQISQPSFDQWFSNTTAVHIGDSLIISGNDPFATDWLYRRYSSLILNAVDQIRGNRESEITFRFSEGSKNTDRITIERCTNGRRELNVHSGSRSCDHPG
ncbi:DnaA N-terminal domain-containing protein [Paenibacillus sp. MCAF20]